MITVTRPGLRGIRRRGGDKCFGVERLLVRLELEGGPDSCCWWVLWWRRAGVSCMVL